MYTRGGNYELLGRACMRVEVRLNNYLTGSVITIGSVIAKCERALNILNLKRFSKSEYDSAKESLDTVDDPTE